MSVIPRGRALWLGATLLCALPILVLLSTAQVGPAGLDVVGDLRILLSGEDTSERAILMLRLQRAICAAGVGGALALAGAMCQGLFRNPLAEPGLIGVGSGAMLGALIGIAALGGYGPSVIQKLSGSLNRMIIPCLALCGAFCVALAVYRMASRQGRVSIPALLLTGLAFNSLLGAVTMTLQVLLIEDWEVARSLFSWGFGDFDDRTPFDVAMVWTGALIGLAAIPWVGLELDLLAGGEEDTAALGADPVFVRTVVLACVAIATATAVASSGQIAFVGLLVPHVMRMIVGPHHRSLLPVSFLAGAALLLFVVAFQYTGCKLLALHASDEMRKVFERVGSLQPGVFTSLLGAPFFLYILAKQGKRLDA